MSRKSKVKSDLTRIEGVNRSLDDIVDSLLDIINVNVNPLLIKSLVQTENGLDIVLFNDVSLSLVNGFNSLLVNRSLDDIDKTRVNESLSKFKNARNRSVKFIIKDRNDNSLVRTLNRKRETEIVERRINK